MALSHHDREALTTRVERKLAGRRISRDVIRATVEQVCSALDSSGTALPNPEVLVVMSATSTPDLASRLRHRLAPQGVQLAESGVATVGRHTVCVVRVDARDEAAVHAACRDAGWSVASGVSASELSA